MEQYQQHIEPDAIQATTPEELHPVAAAFGGDIGAALEKGGDQVKSQIDILSTHLARMNYYRQQQDVMNKDTDFRTSYTDYLYNQKGTVTKNKATAIDPNTATISDNGNIPTGGTIDPNLNYEVPAAPMMRKGNEAWGATDDSHSTGLQMIQERIQQAQAEGMNQRSLSNLQRMMMNSFATLQSGVSKHEAEQLDAGQSQDMAARIGNLTNGSTSIQNPIAMGNQLDNIKETVNTLGDMKGWGQEERDLMITKHSQDAVQNFANTQLRATGNPQEVYDMLNKLETAGKIDPSINENVQQKISVGFSKMQEAQIRQQNVQFAHNDAQLVQDFANGKYSWSNANDLSGLAGTQNSPKMIEAMQKSLLSKNSGQPHNITDTAFSNIVKDILDSSDKDTLNQRLVSLISTHGQDSQHDLQILSRIAIDRNSQLNGINKDEGKTQNPAQINIEAALRQLGDWSDKSGLSYKNTVVDFMKQMGSNSGAIIDPKAAMMNAQRSEITRNYPNAVTQDAPPSMVIDKNGDTRKLFPYFNKDIKVHPQMRWTPEKKEEGMPLNKDAEDEQKIADQGMT